MAEMARSIKRIRPTDSHDSPDTFRKICSCPYWLIAGRQCGEKVRHLVFQILPDGMHDLIEGIIRRSVDIEVQMVRCQPYDMDGGLLKRYGCLSDQVSHGLTMFTGKDVGPLSGTEHDMVPDRKGNQVRIAAQLLYRVGSEPFIFGGHIHRVFAAFFRR